MILDVFAPIAMSSWAISIYWRTMAWDHWYSFTCPCASRGFPGGHDKLHQYKIC